MNQTATTQIEALLLQSEQAHGQYERSVLNGVYDQNWATWYAQYAIDRNIEKCLNRQLSIEQLSQFLSRSYDQYKAERSQQSWATYIAEKLVKEFVVQ